MHWKLLKISPILLFLLALLAYSLGFFGVIPEAVSTFVMTITGFSGVAALRLFIETHGIKTYLTVAGAVLVSLAMVTGILDYQAAIDLLLSLGLLSGAALGHAVYKKIRQIPL